MRLKITGGTLETDFVPDSIEGISERLMEMASGTIRKREIETTHRIDQAESVLRDSIIRMKESAIEEIRRNERQGLENVRATLAKASEVYDKIQAIPVKESDAVSKIKDDILREVKIIFAQLSDRKVEVREPPKVDIDEIRKNVTAEVMGILVKELKGLRASIRDEIALEYKEKPREEPRQPEEKPDHFGASIPLIRKAKDIENLGDRSGSPEKLI